MLLLDKNGSLNVVNKKGETPLAFASPNIIKLLDLKQGIATTHTQEKKEYNNNKLLIRKKIHNENEFVEDFISFKFEKLSSNSTKILNFENPSLPKLLSFVSEKKQENFSNNDENKISEYFTTNFSINDKFINKNDKF